ncbi:protein shisa-5-like [Sinocyclocheilus rhinocerous]|uniref:protein shisa-5-like n=1 Tax=Sinocyclocheilus rhinocerous TaxID=307959 RepID=UPI0007BA30E4|nr:PREDICTED: protein shisa-5-like [Sinocyclocheilus rhinocerous]
MASTLAVLMLLSAGLFTETVGFGDDCKGYFTSNNVYRSSITCGFGQHCCGTCNDRYCCYFGSAKLSEHEQNMCNIRNSSIAIGLSVVGFVVFIIVFITCCCCPCCCIYKMCKKPRPVVGTHITTVMNTQCIQQQQPVMQGGQYPQYQPVPTQAGYGGQPMQTGPYQGQSYAPGPPPSYHVAMSPGYPTSQGAYDGGQAMYPMQPPAQPGVAPMLSETSNQPAYNPAYMQPPNTGY